MKAFLIILFVMLYALIAFVIMAVLMDAKAKDLAFLSEANAQLVTKNAILIGTVWPVTILVLIIYSFVMMFRLLVDMCNS